MKLFRPAVFVLSTALLPISLAMAQPFSLNQLGGSHSITDADLIGDEWFLEITSQGGPIGQCILRSHEAGVKVGGIHVICSGHNGTIQLGINEFINTFGYVTNISATLIGTAQFAVSGIVISGDVGRPGGSPGTITAGALNSIDIGGDLLANVNIAGGTTTLVDVDGDMTGDFANGLGRILTIDIGGSIGSSGNEVAIRAQDGIDVIVADAIYADIDAQYNSGSGSLVRLAATVGDFVGALDTETLTTLTGVSDPGLYIAGNLEADINIDDDLLTTIEVQGDVDADITVDGDLGGLINIGGSLTTGHTIGVLSLASGGTPGQIIINSLNSGGAWNGSVVVNSTTLATKPYYSNTGLGGAVGLVRFGLHGNECVPSHGGNPETASSVTMAFYGPVAWDSGFPFVVEWFNGFTWVDQSTDWSVISGQGTRHVTIQYDDGTAQIPVDRLYRVTPVTSGDNALICDDLLTTTETPAAAFMYNFSNFVSPP